MEANQQRYPQHESDKDRPSDDTTSETVCSVRPPPNIPNLPLANITTPSDSNSVSTRGTKLPVALPKLPSPVSPSSPLSPPSGRFLPDCTLSRSVSSPPLVSPTGWGLSTSRPFYRLAASPIAEEFERAQQKSTTQGASPTIDQLPDTQSNTSSSSRKGQAKKKPKIPEKPRFLASPYLLNPGIDSSRIKNSEKNNSKSNIYENTNDSSSSKNNNVHQQSVTTNNGGTPSFTSVQETRSSSKVYSPSTRASQAAREDRRSTDVRGIPTGQGTRAGNLRRGSRDITFSLCGSTPRPLTERSRPAQGQRSVRISGIIPREAEEAEVEDISIIQRIYLRAASDLNSNDVKKVEHARLMLHRLKQAGFEPRPKSLSHPLPGADSSPTIKVTLADLSSPAATSTPLLDRPGMPWPGDEPGIDTVDYNGVLSPGCSPSAPQAPAGRSGSLLNSGLADYAENLFTEVSVERDKARAQSHKR